MSGLLTTIDWTTVYLIVAILGITVASVVTRASFWILPPRFELPSRVERALRYAPACALAGIIFPEVFVRGGQLMLTPENLRIWAVLAAAAVFLIKRNMLLMIGVGMGVFTALRLGLPLL